jgi:SAM-dependent methyltransferase
MKEVVKIILKFLHIYHPLQSSYRARILARRLAKHRKEYAQYKGSGFTCNVCKEQYGRFVPDYPSPENRNAIEVNDVIAGFGETIFCPNCMSTARERLVIAQLGEISWKGSKILHLSPEKNIYDFIQTGAEVTTADILPGFYQTIDRQVRKEDATRLSFSKESFDFVIANHILEHIPDDHRAMKEIFRVLKPGGQAILQVPYSEKLPDTIEDPHIADPRMQSRLFGQKDHVRIYALKDYLTRLRCAGFKVSVLPYESMEAYYPFAIQPKECFIVIKKSFIP